MAQGVNSTHERNGKDLTRLELLTITKEIDMDVKEKFVAFCVKQIPVCEDDEDLEDDEDDGVSLTQAVIFAFLQLAAVGAAIAALTCLALYL